MIDRALAVVGLGLSAISIVVPHMFPTLSKTIARTGFFLGVALFIAGGVIAFLPETTAQTVPSINGNCNNFGNKTSIATQ